MSSPAPWARLTELDAVRPFAELRLRVEVAKSFLGPDKCVL
jgi:hypothetical protein